jgi:hypothetical protein
MPPEIAAAVHARITAVEPGLDPVTRRYLDVLTPERWAIEWHLPLWLGRAFGLDPALADLLVRANVFGLLAIRAEDDLVDGEVDARDVAATRTLTAVAMDEALAIYRGLFPASSPVWSVLEASLAEWRAGSSGSNAASRGAPIRIAGFACCVLADRLDTWVSLASCLDHAVSALVGYDQLCDWEVDLGAGRWNAFVARATTGVQDRQRFARNRAAVFTAMLTSDVVARHFEAALEEARLAEGLARELGVTELAAFLQTWAETTGAQGTAIADHYMAIGNEAARLLGAPADMATAVGGSR